MSSQRVDIGPLALPEGGEAKAAPERVSPCSHLALSQVAYRSQLVVCPACRLYWPAREVAEAQRYARDLQRLGAAGAASPEATLGRLVLAVTAVARRLPHVIEGDPAGYHAGLVEAFDGLMVALQGVPAPGERTP